MILGMLYLVGIEKFISAISTANTSLILLASILYLITFPLRGLVVYKVLGKYKNQAGLINSIKTVYVGQFTNMILPSRLGDIARSLYLKKKCDIPMRIAVPNVILDRLWDLIGIISVAIIAIILNPSLIQQSESITVILSALLIIIIFLIIKNLHRILKLMKPLIKKLTKSFKIKSKLDNLEQDVMTYIKEITSDKKLTIELLIISTILWFIECLTAYIIFSALNYNIDITIVLSVITIANLSKVLPTTPQGIGTYEAAVVLLFGYFGIASEIALTVAIIDHLIKNIITVSMGLFVMSDMQEIIKNLRN